jgi:predicted O-methyltransferase YrrM
VEWLNDQRFVINGRTFNCCEIHQFNNRFPADEHVIWKTRDMIEAFLEHTGRQAFRNVLEIGIARGGSTIWLNELLNPGKLVAVDISTNPVEALEKYRMESGRARQVITYYGVDQKDEPKLRHICAAEFADEGIDLIIDDASHYLQETLASFNCLFPRLRPGGLFVIEDWTWSLHLKELARPPLRAAVERAFADKEPMPALICYIILAAAGNIIDGVCVDRHNTYVRRGSGRCGTHFDVAEFNRFHDGSCLAFAPQAPVAPAGPGPRIVGG